jgi:hypothetical protein
MLTKLEIQLYSIVHTLALTQRAQTQDKCNAFIRSSYSKFCSKSWVRINQDDSNLKNETISIAGKSILK